MDPFAATVRHTMSAWQMIAGDERLLVALSGGADSVSLLGVLLELDRRVVAAHFNHGWRGEESDRDEAFVRDLCEDLGVRLVVGRSSPATARVGGGLEQQARAERYEFLQRSAGETSCARIATGHTRDDQAETLLLRIMRGAGVTGLRGILPARRDGVIRPLLEVGREDVLAYLARRGLGCVEDSSNADPRFARNRLRLEVMPFLRRYDPDISRHLAAAARAFVLAERCQRAVAADLLARLADAAGGLDAVRLAAEPAARRRLAVRAWLRRRRGDLRGISAPHVEAIATCVRSGTRIELPGGQGVRNEHGTLRFVAAAPPDEAAPASVALHPGEAVVFAGRWRLSATPVEEVAASGAVLPGDLDEALLDADRVAPPLEVRCWRPGDRIQPLGMSGHRKLSDVFIDAKVPRWRRARLPLVEGAGRILWVPGVVRGEGGRVDAATRRVIRLRADERAAKQGV